MPPASIRKQLPSWQQESTAEGANSLLPYAPTSPIQRRSGPFVYRLGHLVFNQARGVRLPYGLPLLENPLIFHKHILQINHAFGHLGEKWGAFVSVFFRCQPQKSVSAHTLRLAAFVRRVASFLVCWPLVAMISNSAQAN